MEEILDDAGCAPTARTTGGDIDESWFANAAAGALEPDHPRVSRAAIGSATLARDATLTRRAGPAVRVTVARRGQTAQAARPRRRLARLAGIGVLLLALVVVLALTLNPPRRPSAAALPQPRHAAPSSSRPTPRPPRATPTASRATVAQLLAPITAPGPARAQRRRARPATTGTPKRAAPAAPPPPQARVVVAAPPRTPRPAPSAGRVAPLAARHAAAPRVARDPSYTPGDLPPASSTH